MIYVGKNTRNAEKRFKKYKATDSFLGRAIRTHVVENFKLDVIEECTTLEEFNKREVLVKNF